MTKADIVNEIARATGLDRASVLTTVEHFMDVVKGSLANGENVYLRGFGSFIIKERKAKTARNITKKTSLIVLSAQYPCLQALPFFQGGSGKAVTLTSVSCTYTLT